MNKANLQLRFRKMTISDLDTVHQIDMESFSLPWPRSSFLYEISSNEAARFWVIELVSDDQAERVIGMLGGWLIVDEFHIGTIAIKKENRGLHIGYRLVVFCLSEVFKSGAKSVFLEVRRSNVIAQRMYQQLGFQVEGVRLRYYSDNHEDAIIMNLYNLNKETIASWKQVEMNEEVPCLMK